MTVVQTCSKRTSRSVTLDRSIEFYRTVVGLRPAHVTPTRHAAFFWIGGAGNAMLGLWLAGSGPQRMTMHVAFRAEPGGCRRRSEGVALGWHHAARFRRSADGRARGDWMDACRVGVLPGS